MAQPENDGRRPFTTAGERLDSMFGDASQRVEQETQLLIKYINDELVPAIREGSTKALRVAAEKLQRAAEVMEEGNRQKKP